MKRTGGQDADSEDRGGTDRVGQDIQGQVDTVGGQEKFISLYVYKIGGDNRRQGQVVKIGGRE